MRSEKEKIVALHQGAIGDLILSVPALLTIKKAYPGRGLELLGFPAILALIENMADRIVSIDSVRLSALYGECEDIPPGLRSFLEGFERIFLFSARDTGRFIENMQRCNPATLPVRTFPEGPQHVTDFQLAQLEAAGYMPADPVPRVTVLPENYTRAEKYLRNRTSGGRLIAVHPGSGGKKKNWPVALLASLLHQVHAETGAGLLLIQGPADQDQVNDLVSEISELPYKKVDNADLPLVATLISRCALFIGNDSGMSHVAAALGVSTIVVFGPTDPAVWGPRGESVSILRDIDSNGQWRWPGPDVVLSAALGLLRP